MTNCGGFLLLAVEPFLYQGTQKKHLNYVIEHVIEAILKKRHLNNAGWLGQFLAIILNIVMGLNLCNTE